MVPPPTHGLAQPVPKWLDFLLHPQPPFVPRESGRPLAKMSFNPEVPQASPNPFPSHLRARLPWGGGGKKGSLQLLKVPLPLGQFRSPTPLLELRTRLHSPCNNRALGLGCCFCSWTRVEPHGKASWVLTV